MTRNLLIFAICASLCSCAGPQVTRVQELSSTADAPYDNVLVIVLFESFDMRRYFEQEIVKQLSERGVHSVASTSLMDTKTPVTRQTFLAMVDAQRSDAVLVSRLVSVDTKARKLDARPESTYIIRPTYYYNVWSVELTEFVSPQDVQTKHSIVFATQLYSANTREVVWAIESNTKITRDQSNRGDFSYIVGEAKAITSYLSRDGLLAP